MDENKQDNQEGNILSEEELIEQYAEEKRRLQDRLNTLGASLQRKADEQVKLKNVIEQRWLDDLRQYHGQYDSETMKAIKSRKGSEVFVNITRHKANAAEARLADMLFPTDDKNWGIQPTPVPQLAKLKNEGQVRQDPATGQQVDVAAEAARIEKQSEDAAKLMTKEIEDQLQECGYNAEARDTIHDAVVLGSGILKGPVVEGRTLKKWAKTPEGRQLTVEQEITPCARRVSAWDFFPDMSATRIEECEFFFERHYYTRAELADLAQVPGFMEDPIREIITNEEGKRRATANSYLSQVREINGYTGDVGNDNRYEVWEYYGSISEEDLDAAGIEYDTESLHELRGTIWFVENRVIKVSLNPMDTAEAPYSVFCFDEDDTNIFGQGVPYLMRNAQAVINSSWRMIMDNAGLSSGPQIVVNKQLVEPADGDWTMTPRKIWNLKEKMRSVHEVFGSYEISSHQQELANIFQVAKQLADEETSVPLIAQGEQGNTTQTASGMSMLMNNANIVLRRSVKVWDDNVTRPMLQRFYDWNMQFNNKEEVKGDFKIDARGSSALMAREMQMQNMANLMQMSQMPAFAPMTKFADLYRMALRQMQIPVNDVVMSDEEIQKLQQQQAQQPPQPEDPLGEARLQLDSQKQQQDAQFKQQELQNKQRQIAVEEMRAKLDYEATMTKIADQKELTLEQLATQMGLKQMDLASKEKLMAFETQVKQAYGEGI